jgi:hypothetical protein
VRAQHGAAPLTWSDELASKAQQWANGCVFEHSGGTLGPFGGTISWCLVPVYFNQSRFAENLAAGTGSSYDIAAAVKSWTDEVCKCRNTIRQIICLSSKTAQYDPNNPVPSHFTQVSLILCIYVTASPDLHL